MQTTELTEALTRLEQDGETAVAKAARAELDEIIKERGETQSIFAEFERIYLQQAERIAELEKAITELLKHYHDQDDSDDAYWVDDDYNKVLSSDPTRRWMLTNKTIMERKAARALKGS
jgi:hypothetical protein